MSLRSDPDRRLPWAHVTITPAGKWRANWRDPTGRKKAKTFPTRRDAKAYLAETAIGRGGYVDPHAGRIRFREVAERWAGGRVTGARDREAIRSSLRSHVFPKWGDWPVGKIDHLAIQRWVRDLSIAGLKPTTVVRHFGTLAGVLRAAVRARLIAVDPSEGVTLPAVRRGDLVVVDLPTFADRLLPVLPAEHRALPAAGAGAGLRRGECAGLPWGNVDLESEELRVVQVAEETSGAVVIRPYPKTRAGRRTVPMAPFLAEQLRARLAILPAEPDPRALVFATRTGNPAGRSTFRRRVWRPALVRAGMLGRVEQLGEHRYRAVWPDSTGSEWSAEFPTEREAIAHVAAKAAGGLRFHDLRHSYATWLVSRGVPINDVAAALGHERPSTTLNLYTHPSKDRSDRIRKAFSDDADVAATFADSRRESGLSRR
jgi:integrase